MDASMNSSTPTPLTSGPPPFLAPPLRPRDLDEDSIASDFSVIPDGLVEAEGGVGHCRTISTTSFLHSEDLQPSLTAMESHGKVTFQSVQATYFCDSDIAVSYTLGSDVLPKSSDRVGLYRVGFSSPQDYLGYQWAPSPSPDHTANGLPLTVVFKASSLPKEVGEFFQFCYVTHEGQIVGVSAPFQLLRVGASREMCVVEEDGMVVVRSSESVLHDKINELSVENEKLLGETKEMHTAKEEMTKQLEEKTQQLNMCQHHLQALEVKMKRETAEKCELMGRIGQVVEEKGHLEDKLRTLDRTLETEKARAEVNEAKVKELEEAALISRKAIEKMTLTLRTLEEDLATTKDALQVTSYHLEEEKRAREKAVKELEIWTSTVEADQSEKNSLALKFSAVNEELISKLEELEANRKNYYTLEEKIKATEMELEAAKGRADGLQVRLDAVEREKEVFLAREEVLAQDNTHLQGSNTALKERLAHLEEQQRSEQKGREAAETIASDLSGRLQAAKAEYHSLALTNRKLAKKLKKMRQKFGVESTTVTASTMSTSTSSMSSWLHAEVEEEEEEEEEEEGDEIGRDEIARDETGGNKTQGNEPSGGDEHQPSMLSQSCHSSLISQHTVGASCCSHSTQQLSDAVNKKMEDIVRVFSKQILSLKLQLQEKEEKKQTVLQHEEVVEVQPAVEEEEEEEEEEENEETMEDAVPEKKEDSDKEEEEEEAAAVPGVLYSNSFLPTAPTAPVFLPEGGKMTTNTTTTTTTPPHPTTTTTSTTTTAPQPSTTSTDPTPAPRAHYYMPKMVATPLQAASNGGIGFRLPPPLLPETTPTARHAAVLSQFTQQQQQVPTAPPAPGHDSDDDDFHSTSDSDSPPATASPPPPPPPSSTSSSLPSAAVESSLPQHLQLQQSSRSDGSLSPEGNTPNLMPCPLCPLSFPMGTRRLLEEHVNSHLEHVCPMCSEVFQRNCQEKFQEHVESHFRDEDDEEQQRRQEAERRDEEDPSGPWGRHLRNAHLLEID